MHYLYYFFFTLVLYLQVFILKHSNLALVVMTQWLTYSWEITPALGLRTLWGFQDLDWLSVV